LQQQGAKCVSGRECLNAIPEIVCAEKIALEQQKAIIFTCFGSISLNF
jgi:hypothetical protein